MWSAFIDSQDYLGDQCAASWGQQVRSSRSFWIVCEIENRLKGVHIAVNLFSNLRSLSQLCKCFPKLFCSHLKTVMNNFTLPAWNSPPSPLFDPSSSGASALTLSPSFWSLRFVCLSCYIHSIFPPVPPADLCFFLVSCNDKTLSAFIPLCRLFPTRNLNLASSFLASLPFPFYVLIFSLFHFFRLSV